MVAEDRPGWDGRSAATDLAGNAQAALALLDSRGWERATIVGHSFGGAVACWMAADAPERVSELVLVSPSANTASLYRIDRWLASSVGGLSAAAMMMGTTGLALGVGATRRRLAGRLHLHEDYLAAASHRLRSPSAWRSFVVEQRALVKDLPGLERRLPGITAPTRIVIGSEDRVLPPGSAQALAGQIAGAELSVLEGAGHLLPMLAPGRLAEVIRGARVQP